MQGEMRVWCFEARVPQMFLIGLGRGRFCVLHCVDLKLLYNREHEMKGIKRPQLRVVPKNDLWDILENEHELSCCV